MPSDRAVELAESIINDQATIPISIGEVLYLAKEILNARKDSRHRRLDTERMDWLEQRGLRPVAWNYDGQHGICDIYTPAVKFEIPVRCVAPPLREAIDAAMEKESDDV